MSVDLEYLQLLITVWYVLLSSENLQMAKRYKQLKNVLPLNLDARLLFGEYRVQQKIIGVLFYWFTVHSSDLVWGFQFDNVFVQLQDSPEPLPVLEVDPHGGPRAVWIEPDLVHSVNPLKSTSKTKALSK